MSAFLCPDCNGDGTRRRYANVIPEPCETCEGTGDLLLARLDRIAFALEVIASDITERRERERAVLVSQYQHLKATLRRAVSQFGAADNAMARRDQERITDRDREWHRDCEQAVATAQADLDDFIAAHPGIEETAGDA